MGYSPWGPKELDMTESEHTHTHTHTHTRNPSVGLICNTTSEKCNTFLWLVVQHVATCSLPVLGVFQGDELYLLNIKVWLTTNFDLMVFHYVPPFLAKRNVSRS